MTMTRTQMLLAKLAEEGVEVAQISLKTQQVGLSEVMPSELDDLMAQIEMLNEECGFGYTPNRSRIEAKKVKVNKFAALSASLGQIA